jgi:hypothetical protein
MKQGYDLEERLLEYAARIPQEAPLDASLLLTLHNLVIQIRAT